MQYFPLSHEKAAQHPLKEYDLAGSLGIPILGFVHAGPNTISAGKPGMDSDARQKLDAFRAKVRTPCL